MALWFLYKDVPTGVWTADAIHVYHAISVMFIYIGWILLPARFLWVYLIYVGLTLFSWVWNADICPMTQTEYNARGWNLQTTPGFTQLFLVRPLTMTFGYPANSRLESRLTDGVLEVIKVFFAIALVRYTVYMIQTLKQ